MIEKSTKLTYKMSPPLFLVHGERYVGSVFELLSSERKLKVRLFGDGNET